MVERRFIRSYVIRLMKSSELVMEGRVEGVNASMSWGRPGTAAEMSVDGPRVLRRVERRMG